MNRCKPLRSGESVRDVEFRVNDSDDSDGGAGSELTAGERQLRPLYLLSRWVEPGTTTKMVSVAIVLPSGVGAGDFSVRVVDSGQFLELTVQWPAALVDIEVMHRKWLRMIGNGGFQKYHPKYLGFEAALKKLRERNSDKVESSARIPLPFPVLSHFHGKYNLAWTDSNVRMLYVDLRAFIEDYAVVNDKDSFEVV